MILNSYIKLNSIKGEKGSKYVYKIKTIFHNKKYFAYKSKKQFQYIYF